MASQKTKFAVGLFLACGMVFAVLVIIWLGMSRFLEKGRYYVTYFDESVQGLNIDSPVKYRGVFIGRVDRIDVAPDSKLIQVVLKIESGQTLDSSIVAQLKSVGITGSMFIEIDRKKTGEPDQSPKLNFPTKYPIVASKPSEIGELISGINAVLDQIKSLDVKRISDNLEASLGRANLLLNDQRWDRILSMVDQGVLSFNSVIKGANRSLDRLDKTIVRFDGIVEEKEKSIKAGIENFKLAMQRANVFLEKGSALMDGTDAAVTQLTQHLLIVAQNLEKASENLNQIMELLADQPSQLIFGAPPVPRNVDK
jgi:phospholipid/cholesterol/gamma-HCH transport system substrate-binding protein